MQPTERKRIYTDAELRDRVFVQKEFTDYVRNDLAAIFDERERFAELAETYRSLLEKANARLALYRDLSRIDESQRTNYTAHGDFKSAAAAWALIHREAEANGQRAVSFAEWLYLPVNAPATA